MSPCTTHIHVWNPLRLGGKGRLWLEPSEKGSPGAGLVSGSELAVSSGKILEKGCHSQWVESPVYMSMQLILTICSKIISQQVTWVGGLPPYTKAGSRVDVGMKSSRDVMVEILSRSPSTDRIGSILQYKNCGALASILSEWLNVLTVWIF